jgi:hypothetical protein
MEPTKERRPNRVMLWVGGAAAAVGIALGAAGIAAAATNDSGSTTTPAASSSDATGTATPSTGAASNSAAAPDAGAPAQDPATMDHGPGETLLTGDTAAKVTAAAKAAIPDGTILRVETDNEGAPYEAHVKKADGTIVTLKFDASFNVTSTVDGFGAGGPGGGNHGQPPAGSSGSSNGSSATTNG